MEILLMSMSVDDWILTFLFTERACYVDGCLSYLGFSDHERLSDKSATKGYIGVYSAYQYL